jgi:hypothetical protein
LPQGAHCSPGCTRDGEFKLTDDYPNDAERNALDSAHATLTEYGVLPGPKGYDVPTLAARVYANGWAYSIDRLGPQFRAAIRPGTEDVHSFHVVELGWSADVAMVLALVKALPHMSAALATSSPGAPE